MTETPFRAAVIELRAWVKARRVEWHTAEMVRLIDNIETLLDRVDPR